MIRRRRLLPIFAAVIALAASATGCAAGPSSAGGPSSGDGVTIVRCGGMATSHAVFLAAHSALDDAARKLGTSIKYLDASGPDCVTSVASKTAAVGVFAYQGAAQMAAKGQDAVQIVSLFNGGGILLVGASKFKQSRGTDVAKWNGATFGITGVGQTTDTWARAAVTQAGLNYKDQKTVVIPFASLVPALRAGQVDLVACDVACAVEAEKSGVGYVVYNSNVPEAAKAIGGTFISPSALVTTRSFVRDNPQFAQALTDAMVKSLLDIQAHINDPAAILAMMPDEFRAKTDPATWATTWNLLKGAYASPGLTGAISQQDFNNIVKELPQLGAVQPGTPIKPETIDNSLIIQAYKNLGRTPPAVPAQLTGP